MDGTGTEPFRSDVEIVSGLIRLPAGGRSDGGVRVIDVDGAVIAPGFIDSHSHADLAAVYADDSPTIHECRVLQGVTTEIIGNCGFSPYPVPDSTRERVLANSGAAFGGKATTYATLDIYASDMSGRRLPSNVAPLVGHGALRAAYVGPDDRPAEAHELAQMRDSLRKALRAGAFGMSTGLAYTPGCFAPLEEIVALAGDVAASDAMYVSHIRSITDGVDDAIEEAIEIADRAEARLHISHLKLAGEANWGRSQRVLARLDAANESGLSVSTDVYPYTAGSTSLHALLPPRLFTNGMSSALELLRDPQVRRKAEDEMRAGVKGWQNLGTNTGWENVRIASAKATPQHVGQSIADVARSLDAVGPVDAIAALLQGNDGRVLVVMHNMDEVDLRTFMNWEHTMIGSDGIPVGERPHPRIAGTFPRVLGRYVGEDGLPSLAVAVSRMSGVTARRFGIPDRGLISDGMVADVVVFDPVTVLDTATYEDSLSQPTGIQHVFVSGRQAVESGAVVNDGLGRVLRKRASNGIHNP
jgi:N-acyl-D-aspartate/D-glutamate deacylase